MRKLVIPVLMVSALIGGCSGTSGDESAIKTAVKRNLKDPDSAKFEQMSLSEDKKRACIVWNAKNSMGGYGEWQIAKLEKSDAEWKVTALEGGQSYECVESGFKALDAEHSAKVAAEDKGIEILQRARNVSREAAIELSNGECSVVYQRYIEEAGRAARFPLASKDKPFPETELGRIQADLEAGRCKI